MPKNAACLRDIGAAWNTKGFLEVLEKEFAKLEKISIDYGVMERAAEVYMCELDCHWVDVGSYQALAETIGVVDQEGNVTTDNTSCLWSDCGNNIAISNAMIATTTSSSISVKPGHTRVDGLLDVRLLFRNIGPLLTG